MIRYATAVTLTLICALLTPFAARAVTIPGGPSLFVRTLDQVSSNDKAGKSFAARLDSNLVVKGKVVVRAGSNRISPLGRTRLRGTSTSSRGKSLKKLWKVLEP
jgi:hypothetical protein